MTLTRQRRRHTPAMPVAVDSLIVKRTATGLGLFTLKPVKASRRIIEYTGPLITNEEVMRRRGRYFFEVDDNYSIDGGPRSNTARYINHLCRPNCEAYVYGRRIWIY